MMPFWSVNFKHKIYLYLSITFVDVDRLTRTWYIISDYYIQYYHNLMPHTPRISIV